MSTGRGPSIADCFLQDCTTVLNLRDKAPRRSDWGPGARIVTLPLVLDMLPVTWDDQRNAEHAYSAQAPVRAPPTAFFRVDLSPDGPALPRVGRGGSHHRSDPRPACNRLGGRVHGVSSRPGGYGLRTKLRRLSCADGGRQGAAGGRTILEELRAKKRRRIVDRVRQRQHAERDARLSSANLRPRITISSR